MTATLIQAGLETAPPPSPALTGLCLAVAREYPKQPAVNVIAFGIKRFREKLHAEPTTILTSFADAADLEGKTDLQVEPKTFIAGGHFYLKRDAG